VIRGSVQWSSIAMKAMDARIQFNG
jgi:hypothetical protein